MSIRGSGHRRRGKASVHAKNAPGQPAKGTFTRLSLMAVAGLLASLVGGSLTSAAPLGKTNR
jgi:hypothetical protein